MCTTHSSSCRGAWIWSPSIFPLGVGLDLIPLNFPLGCGPGSAWTWSPSISPLGVGQDLIPLNFPIGCGPRPDPPQFPPWVWASTWSTSISPLGVGLEHTTTPKRRHPPRTRPPGAGTPLGAGTPPTREQASIPPVNRMTNRCKNITLPQTSFAGGKNDCETYDFFPDPGRGLYTENLDSL